MFRPVLITLLALTACTPPPEAPTLPAPSASASPLAPRRVASAIDVSAFPSDLNVGETVNFPAQVVFSDGSQGDGLVFFYTPEHLFEKTEQGLRLLAPGRLTVTVRSLQNADIQETRSFVIRDPRVPEPTPSASPSATPGTSASATPSPTPSPTSPSNAAAELKVLSDYYLNFKVGMSWKYSIRLAALAAANSGSMDYPDPLPLAWGLNITDMNSENRSQRIVAYLQDHNDLGSVELTVTAVDAETVTLLRTLKTSLPGLAEIPASEQSYTRETIGLLYTNLLQQSPPAQRRLQRSESNTDFTSFHVSPPEKYTVDVLSGVSPLNDGLHTEEELTLYMHREKGMLRQVVNQRGLRQGSISVDTALMLYLEEITGF